jgi:competence protein ComEC
MSSVEVRGYIELVEPKATRGQRITLRVTSLGDLAPAARPYRVRVSTGRTTPGLQAGSPMHLRATLMPPAEPALPGDYDFARQAWFERLGGLGYTWTAAEIDPRAAMPPWDLRAWAAVERLWQAIAQRVTAILPGQTGAIAVALIRGARGGITDQTNTAFRDSGLLHVLSISGLHMAVMAGAVFYLVRLILAAVPALALVYPIKKWAAAAAMLGAFAYLMISGSSFATVRSAIMIAIMFLAVILDRPALALRNVVLAACLILLLFPESLFDVGFQMSFAAVVALISVYEALSGRGAVFASRGAVVRFVLFMGGIVLSTLIASAAVAPFAAYYFHKSQQYAVLANLIAIPICDLLVMPAALAALILMPLGLEAPALWVMGRGVDAMLWTAERVAALPGAVLRIPAMPTAAFLLMIAGGLWLALWQTRWRLAGAALVAAGLALAPTLRLPDLLIGRDGALVAVRAQDGRLEAVGSGRASFELARWLEHDGDDRTAKEAGNGAGFLCDAIGCRTRVKGLTVAVAQRPAAFAEDCRRASILVAPIASPKSCSAPKAVVDFFAARREGTHALYVEDDGRIRVETVAQTRGERPWSGQRAAQGAPKTERARAPPAEESEPGEMEPGTAVPPDPPQ